MQVQHEVGTGLSGSDSGVDEVHDYDQDNDAHHVIQPQTDTDEASTDTDEGYADRFRRFLVPVIYPIRSTTRRRNPRPLVSLLRQTRVWHEAYMLRGYTQVLGGRPEDLQMTLADAKREVRDPSIHTYVQYWITYAMKPFEE